MALLFQYAVIVLAAFLLIHLAVSIGFGILIGGAAGAAVTARHYRGKIKEWEEWHRLYGGTQPTQLHPQGPYSDQQYDPRYQQYRHEQPPAQYPPQYYPQGQTQLPQGRQRRQLPHGDDYHNY